MVAKRSSTTGDGPEEGSATSLDGSPTSRSLPSRDTATITPR